MDDPSHSHSKPAAPPRAILTRRNFLALAGASTLGLALYAGEIERHETDVVYRTISLTGLPDAFVGFRIIQLSDIHLEEFTETEYLKAVIRKINALQPDLVVLTGDYVSTGPRSAAFSIRCGERCAELLTEIACERKYAVLGNHDAVVAPAAITAALVSRGIPVLANRSLPIERGGSRIWLAGLEDAVAQRPDLDAALPPLRNAEREPLILLAHEPDVVDGMLNRQIGLVLSGHTHGGQIRLPFLGPAFLPVLGRKYLEGHFAFPDGTQMYVNRGIGTVGVPFRFLCPPELTVFTLARK